jgi:hypothetical protein
MATFRSLGPKPPSGERGLGAGTAGRPLHRQLGDSARTHAALLCGERWPRPGSRDSARTSCAPITLKGEADVGPPIRAASHI